MFASCSLRRCCCQLFYIVTVNDAVVDDDGGCGLALLLLSRRLFCVIAVNDAVVADDGGCGLALLQLWPCLALLQLRPCPVAVATCVVVAGNWNCISPGALVQIAVRLIVSPGAVSAYNGVFTGQKRIPYIRSASKSQL